MCYEWWAIIDEWLMLIGDEWLITSNGWWVMIDELLFMSAEWLMVTVDEWWVIFYDGWMLCDEL